MVNVISMMYGMYTSWYIYLSLFFIFQFQVESKKFQDYVSIASLYIYY